MMQRYESAKEMYAKIGIDAEAALKPVAEELSGLKRQINAMTSAIFGKYLWPRLREYPSLKYCRFNMESLNRCKWPHCSSGL